MKLTERKKKVLIVLGTIVGLIALFLFVVFVPVGDSEKKQDTAPDDVVKNEHIDEKEANAPELEDDDSEITGLEGRKNNSASKNTTKAKKESDSPKNEVVIPAPNTSVQTDNGGNTQNNENRQEGIPDGNQASEVNDKQTYTQNEEQTATDNKVTENADDVGSTTVQNTDNSNMVDTNATVDENTVETNASEPTAPTPSEPAAPTPSEPTAPTPNESVEPSGMVDSGNTGL